MAVKQAPQTKEAADLARSHGIDPFMLPRVANDDTTEERLLKEQRDTLAYQWMREYAKIEELSRTCLYCDFVGKTRISLRAHMKKHGCHINAAQPLK